MTSQYDTTNNEEWTAKVLDAAKHIATVSAHGKSVHTRTNGRFGCSPFAELVNACFPLAMRMTFTLAMRDVYEERRRQVTVEGWTPEHDDDHVDGSMALAAALYAIADEGEPCPPIWPWESLWWKPRDKRRNLVRAAALLVAEIERIDRMKINALNPQNRPTSADPL